MAGKYSNQNIISSQYQKLPVSNQKYKSHIITNIVQILINNDAM